jgi:DNA-binding LacI/PurR family transcriptional regulator
MSHDAVVDQLISAEGGMPTGLFIPRDVITIGVYRSLRARGLKPGRDIDIISCDNTPALDALEVRPATIDIRPEEIGRRAVEQLLWRIGNRDAPMNVTALVEPQIIQGDPVDLACVAKADSNSAEETGTYETIDD